LLLWHCTANKLIRTSKISQAIKDDTNSIRTHVSAIQSAVDNVQREQISASQRIILEWISSSDYPAQQSDIIKRRQEGTGQWFLDAPEVAQWLSEAKTTLFCPGIQLNQEKDHQMRVD
jgi:hypothetical protein